MTELTDERLLSMAAKALGYASIDPDRGAEEGPGSFRQALEVFPEELIAFARAVLAAEPPAPVVPDEVRVAFTELERRQENLRRFRDLRKELAAEPPAPVLGWQPIDTAPHDGTEILASDKVGGMLRACLNRGIVDHCRTAIAADRAANTPSPSHETR